MAKATVATAGAGAVAQAGLGEMPLTLWLLVGGVIATLYLSRASRTPAKPAPKPKPTVRIP